jgi:uncharacterized protein
MAAVSPEDLGGQQDALAAYIRDPEHAAPPPGIEQRRLRIYRDLFFNNVSGMLAGSFPVIHRILGEEAWARLIRGFFRDHDSHTPLFTELAREFLRYLENDEVVDQPPWLRELAHYEWIELALQLSEASDDEFAHDASGDLLEGAPVVSPVAWPVAYAWPVQRIGPDWQPAIAPANPTLLLLHRGSGDKIDFHELNPLTYRLLQRLDASPELSGREQLEALAREASRSDVEAFVAEGAAMLQHWRSAGIVLGTRA